MDISEVKAAKIETESKIAKLILDFQTECGVYVKHVDVTTASNLTTKGRINQVSSINIIVAL